MGCGTITIGSINDCTAPLKSGTSPRLFLANYDDLVTATESTSTPNLITSLTMASTTVFYMFEGFKQDVKPTQEVIAPSNGANQFKHTVGWIIYNISQLQKNNIQRLAKGRFIAIVENKGKDANSFELYGLGTGLEIVPGVARDSYANGGGYILQLATPENEFEPKLPQTLFATDYATTLALVNGYAALPTITTVSDIALQVAGGDAETITGTGFYGGGASSAVVSVQWVNQTTQAATTQSAVTVVSNTSITFTSVALVAGAYKLRITTSRGVVDSGQTAVAS
jgi:hypothetical protein